jgi:hypothetical protein
MRVRKVISVLMSDGCLSLENISGHEVADEVGDNIFVPIEPMSSDNRQKPIFLREVDKEIYLTVGEPGKDASKKQSCLQFGSKQGLPFSLIRP